MMDSVLETTSHDADELRTVEINAGDNSNHKIMAVEVRALGLCSCHSAATQLPLS